MSFKRYKGVFALGASLLLAACNIQNTPKSVEPVPSPEPEEVVGPSVFILTGQSNMEGQTLFESADGKTQYLRNALAKLEIDDAECCFEGIPEVRTSYYGCGYGEIGDPSQIHASNKETPIEGKFENTKVGMGAMKSSGWGQSAAKTENAMGPELGCAYKLKDYASEEAPIYFIKAGVSGSGFAQTGSNAINWNIEEDPNLYDRHLKPYTENCLRLIEEESGKKPIIRGFLWMQGESDTEQKKIDAYEDRFDAFVGKLKTDFAGYAKDGNGANIAVIDACIYDGPNTQWGAQTSVNMNNLKMEMAETHQNQYCINTSCKLDGGMGVFDKDNPLSIFQVVGDSYDPSVLVRLNKKKLEVVIFQKGPDLQQVAGVELVLVNEPCQVVVTVKGTRLEAWLNGRRQLVMQSGYLKGPFNRIFRGRHWKQRRFRGELANFWYSHNALDEKEIVAKCPQEIAARPPHEINVPNCHGVYPSLKVVGELPHTWHDMHDVNVTPLAWFDPHGRDLLAYSPSDGLFGIRTALFKFLYLDKETGMPVYDRGKTLLTLTGGRHQAYRWPDGSQSLFSNGQY
ncbi:MAG: hypothetical protein J6328_02320, partial [Bacilli bacterium]|nr:hypothetical protein [Bacilli bacterium]